MNFDQLRAQATAVIAPRQLSESAEAGGVGAAIETADGNVYVGVCLDLACSVGFCAEHAAAAAMVTAGENQVVKMVAINWNGDVLPPCGRCREFIGQLHPSNRSAAVLVGPDAVRQLADLLPFDWREAR